MKRSRIILSLAVAAVSAIGVQVTGAQPIGVSDFAVLSEPTSQTWQMVRYGVEKPSLYTGAMTTSIPIYTYEDPDFDIPISLEYAFDGYRPAVHSGPVGMGWRLSCGGVLVRSVIGLPDEISSGGMFGYFFSTQYGYPGCFDEDESGDAILESTASHGDSSMGLVYRNIYEGVPVFVSRGTNIHLPSGQFDTSSDVYQFTYPGGRGSFVVLPDGSIKVFDADRPFGETRISVTYNMAFSGVECPEFRVDAGDGYVYVYGGRITNTEYTADSELTNDAVRYSALTLWKIIAPNGRSVEFVYSTRPQYELSFEEVRHGHAASSGSIATPTRETKTKYYRVLSSVRVDGRDVVRFNYEEKESKEFQRSSFVDTRDYRVSACGESVYDEEKRLASVVVVNADGERVDSLVLRQHHTSSNASSPKMFLDSVSGNMGRYSFRYDHSSVTDSYPAIDSPAEDHWGFWRGTGGGLPISSSTQQDASLYNLSSEVRSPVLQYTMYGAMTCITYPGGGSSCMEYEANDAGKLLDRNVAETGVFLRDNDSLQFRVGGVRVSSITRYDTNDGNAYTTRYGYANPENGSSSGILTSMRRYAILSRYSTSEIATDATYRRRTSSGSAAVYSRDGLYDLSHDSHIGYSHVQEYHPDGSWTDYFFYSWEDTPDGYSTDAADFGKRYYYTSGEEDDDYFTVCVSGVISPETASEQIRMLSLLTESITDNSSLRGRLKERRDYRASGAMSQRTMWDYNRMENTYINRIDDMLSCYRMCETEHVFFCLSGIEQTTWEGGCPYTVSTVIGVNDLGQKVYETSSGGGFSKSVSYVYCHELSAADTVGVSQFLSAVRSKTTTVGDFDELERCTFFYDGESGNPRPVLMTQTRDGESRTTSVVYDSNFRPVRIDCPGGRWTRYLWSSDGRHLLGTTGNDPSNTTTYTWEDLVGLSSVSLPSGLSETYVHDVRGRLSERRDSDGAVTTSYEYNLVNE